MIANPPVAPFGVAHGGFSAIATNSQKLILGQRQPDTIALPLLSLQPTGAIVSSAKLTQSAATIGPKDVSLCSPALPEGP